MPALLRFASWALAAALAACGGGDPTLTVPVGGTVTGLAGSGLVLQLNGGNDLPMAADGSFTFGSRVVSGDSYTVTVKSQPANPSQTCTVSNASGRIGTSAISDVAVVCATNRYTVGGSVSGLSGSGLVLQNNAGDDLAIAADGSFSFATPVASGASYEVTVKSQPRLVALRCTVAAGSGTVAAAAVTDVAVTCATPQPSLVLMSRAATGSVEIFRVDAATGALQYLSGIASGGTNPAFIAVEPTMKFAYVANAGSNTLSVFQIDATAGTLTPIAGSPFATAAGPDHISIDPRGRYAYVSHPGSGTVSAYALNALTGVPVEIAGSPFSTGTGSRSLEVAPSGTIAYAMAPSAVNIYSVDPLTGALASAASVAAGSGAGTFAMDPGNRFLYTPYYDISWSPPDAIGAFAVTNTTTGALTQVPGSPFSTTGGGVTSATVDPTGRFAYAVSLGTRTVTSHAIDAATGALTQVDSDGTDPSPNFVKVDPSGRYVYVANDWGSISAFAIDGAGRLTQVGTTLRLSNFGSYGSMGIAVVAP